MRLIISLKNKDIFLFRIQRCLCCLHNITEPQTEEELILKGVYDFLKELNHDFFEFTDLIYYLNGSGVISSDNKKAEKIVRKFIQRLKERGLIKTSDSSDDAEIFSLSN